MRLIHAITISLLSLVVLAGTQTFAKAQSNVSSIEWETLRPEGEEFTILMPKNSTAESSKEPYHKMQLNSRYYLSTTPNGPVFAVVSLSGIKSNPAAYSEVERVNSYVDAFKTLFPPKVRGKDAVAKLTFIGYRKLFGYEGREFGLSIANLSGTAKVVATRRRFYAVVYLNTKKDASLQDHYLSSFILPERVDTSAARSSTQVSTTPADSEAAANAQPSVTAPSKTAATQSPGTEAGTEASPETKPSDPNAATTQTGEKKPVSGGVLNGKALSLPKPDYPAEARAARVAGTVVVQVIIDETGGVISAKAVSGHPLLHDAAVSAALQARFSPTTLMGEPVKVSGVITYNFVAH